MTEIITRSEYCNEVHFIAESLVKDAMEANDNDRSAAEDQIYDYMLHETIDGHRWVIYYSYHDDVLRYSDNSNSYIDQFGNDDAGQVLKERGLNGLKTVMAYFAMEQDVRDCLDDAFYKFEEQVEETAETE